MGSEHAAQENEYTEFYEELMVLLQSMAALSDGALTCKGKTWDGFSLVCNGEEIGDALSVYRAYLLIFGNPIEMAKCFYNDILLTVKKAGIATSYEVGLKSFESLLASLWGDKTLAHEHLHGLVEKYR